MEINPFEYLLRICAKFAQHMGIIYFVFNIFVYPIEYIR